MLVIPNKGIFFSEIFVEIGFEILNMFSISDLQRTHTRAAKIYFVNGRRYLPATKRGRCLPGSAAV